MAAAADAGGDRFTRETTVKCSLEAFCKDETLKNVLQNMAPRMDRI